MSTFIICSEYGELLDLAMHLKYVEEQDVLMHIESAEHKKIGDGIIEKEDNWWRCLGKGYIWVVDGCGHGDWQDWLREQGEAVFGSSEIGGKLENDRQLGQALFKDMGLKQPESHNFKDFESAKKFIQEHQDKQWILKQNGDAPKSLNHKTKFDGAIDMLYHLDQLSKKWNESEYGAVDFDLMEQVSGLEIAVSAFFNGQDFLTGKDGKIAAFLNFEMKKEMPKDMGETTGETGTVFMGATNDNKLVKQLLENEALLKTLRKAKFRGVFDINGCLMSDGYVGFEPTMRPGIPASSYEFLSGSGLQSRTSQLIETIAKGEKKPISIYPGTGIVIVVTAKPYPVEADMDASATSLGEKLWIMKDGKPVRDMDLSQRLRIHLQNFYKKDGNYLVATKNGYLATVTQRGKNVKDARERCMKYIDENIYISGMKYRDDIGEKLEKLGF